MFQIIFMYVSCCACRDYLFISWLEEGGRGQVKVGMSPIFHTCSLPSLFLITRRRKEGERVRGKGVWGCGGGKRAKRTRDTGGEGGGGGFWIGCFPH